jgi:hypothetical protein
MLYQVVHGDDYVGADRTESVRRHHHTTIELDGQYASASHDRLLSTCARVVRGTRDRLRPPRRE